MNICFDGSIFSLQTAGGISKYVAELLPPLGKVLAPNDKLVIDLFPGAQRNFILQTARSKIVEKISVQNLPRLAMLSRITGFGYEKDSHIIHTPYFFLPSSTRVRSVLTVHDLIGVDQPMRRLRAKMKKSLLIKALSRADTIICVSQATRSDLHNLLPEIPEDRSVVIYHGVSDVFASVSEATSLSASNNPGLSFNDPYLLYVGNRGGYKNFRFAVEGLASAVAYRELRMICVGGGQFTSQEQQLFSELGIDGRLIHLSSVTEVDLAQLYRRAFALIYPSFKEGFGMPIIEAMASGCPVICSKFSATGEIAGEAAVLLSAFDLDEFRQAIDRLAVTSERNWIIERGHARASIFSWQQAAVQTYNVYKSLC